MNCFTRKNNKGEHMSLPEEVWVMGHRWTIHETDKEWFEDMDSWGNCCSQKRKIQVYCGGGGSITRDTLLHEVLHACWYILAFSEKEEEERVINSMASILIGIIDDPRNEYFVNFILGNDYDNGKAED